MNTDDMLKKLNTAQDSPFYQIYGYIDENDYQKAIQCIKEYFKCDDNIAKIVCMDFKTQLYDPCQKHLEETVSQLSPAEISYNNAVAQEWQNKPKCPTCGSQNIEKISLTKKAFGGAIFGLFSSNVRNTMYCKNCGYKW